MRRPNDEVYGRYRFELRELLAERGRKQSKAYHTEYSYSMIAGAGTAVQMAVNIRLLESRSGRGRPYSSAEELRRGASEVRLPPGGESLEVRRNVLEAVVSQPSRAKHRLGPIPGAANRTLGWAIRAGLLVPPTGLLTITRTIEQKHLRRKQAIGARGDGRLDVAAVVGAIPDNGGAALVHATHPHVQSRDDIDADLLSYHEHVSKMDLDPLRMRLLCLYAVWLELQETTGVSVPVIQRAERRFDQPDEGSLTSEQLWFATDQPHWDKEVDDVFPREAIVLGECRDESLRGFSYRTGVGERRLGNPELFLRDVEKGMPSLLVSRLQCSQPEAETALEGADDLVRLEGHLVARDGAAFRPVVVLSHPHTVSVVYLIPAERAAAMGTPEWDALREGLAPLHGAASARSSDDQGLGVTIPGKHALSISSKDIDKCCNLDAFRAFSHAMDEPSHWRSPDPPFDEEDESDAA